MMNARLMTALLLVKAWLDPKLRDERGSVSTEQAVVTSAIVLLAVIVVAAISAYAQGKIALLG
ncbi:hypothetical protein [Propionicicella superfundia]|uniref:hypothetical protein n=1 Tax=Propionicicella superfundia TaxID=348582 RepID=UPI0004159850|nr:hypothetical protein [Propionicicella superfundia]